APRSSPWCIDEKARSARHGGIGLLSRRRRVLHVRVRDLRSRTLCHHHAIVAYARKRRRSGNDDQLLHTGGNRPHAQNVGFRLYQYLELYHVDADAERRPVPVSWRPHANPGYDRWRFCTHRDGVPNWFHHVDADLGRDAERAERVHPASLLFDLLMPIRG